MIACSQAVEGVPDLIKLLPLGVVKSQKGNFTVDNDSFLAMCADFAAHGNDLVIDYEHQTLKDMQAPAGGWITELVLSDGAICGRVNWTAKAAEYLANREYRYLSPVVMVDANRKARALKSAALTNTPAIDGMFTIVNAQDFNLDEGENDMDFKELAVLLGLPEDAGAEDILAAVKKLTEDAKAKTDAGELVANKAILSLLALKDDAKTHEVAAAITQLQNPANFVPVAQYNMVANKLQAQESGNLVALALKAGKITPAQKAWAEPYAATDADGFKSFVDLAVPVVPMEQLALSAKPAKKSGIDPAICKQLGISKEDAEKFGKDEF